MKRCLDTTFLVDLMRRRPGAATMAARLDEEPLAPGISVLVQAEFLEGAFYAGGPYLRRAQDLLTDLQLIDVTPKVAAEAAQLGAELLKKGERVDIVDLIIIATAKLESATLVTRDSDQLRVPGVLSETYVD